MAILTNAQETNAPAPGLLRYGLFTAATVSDDLGPREIASGFQFPAEDCGEVLSYDATCVRPFDAKVFDEGLGYMEATPYWVYATRQCGSVGTDAQRMEASVRRRLLANEQHEVEAHLWGGGAVASDPNLIGHVGTTTVVPTGVGSGAAIAALEEAFYDAYGYTGVIHINMRAYANLAYGQLMTRTGAGGRWVTPMGSVWSIGSGYGITGPAGVAPGAGNVWAFMTPPVLIRRSQVIVPPALSTLDRSTNQYMALAERVYAHTWLCDEVFAVEVPIESPAVVGLVI